MCRKLFTTAILLLSYFILFSQTSDDFETGDFTHLSWVMGGDANWTITSSNYYEGSYAARSGIISDNQTSEIEITHYCDPGSFTFMYSVSSEADYDELLFYIDDIQQNSWSGDIGWTKASYSLTEGSHTFKWVYQKDGSSSEGQDAAFIDNVEFPSPMTYSSSTTETASTEPAYIGSQNNEIIYLNVIITGNSSPISTTSITFNTTGTTNTADIENAKVYYTTNTNFTTSDQFGTTTANPNGSFTVNGTKELISGNNYFWLSYDIGSDATEGNIIDAQCTSVTVDGVSKTPDVINPAGTRTINKQYSGGNGTSGNPFQIANLNDLEELMNSSDTWNKYFIQTANIDATNTQTWSGGTGFTPIGNFTTYFEGNYNGQGYYISNLYINRSTTDYMAMFGAVRWADIYNLELLNAQITGQDYTGGIVAYANGSDLSSCKISGSVVGRTNTGGIAGHLFSADISNCENNATVSGRNMVGGIAGKIEQNSTIENTLNKGSVSGTLGYVGGISGYSDLGEINTCCNNGSVNANGNDVAGGIVAENTSASVYNSYSTGNISGGDWIGGLIGLNESSTVEKCYSNGTVSGTDYTGGLIGDNISSTVNNSFWDTQTSGQTSSSAGTGKTTTEMQTKSTFTDAGWDFTYETTNGTDSYWDQYTQISNGYPFLTFQSTVYENDGEWQTSNSNEIIIISGCTVTVPGTKTNEECGYVFIKPNGKLSINGTLTIQNDLLLESDDKNSASILGNTNLTVSGTKTVQSYLEDYGAKALFWHYVAVPVDVSGGAITSNVFGTPYNNSGTDYYALYYDETIPNYVGITDNTTVLSEQMRGYAVPKNSAETLEFTGDLVDGTQTVTLSRDNTGYNLIGNPYPSGLNLGNIDAGLTGVTPTNIATTVWIRENGGFNEYNWQSGATVSGTFAGVLPPMQAAWFRVTEGQTTGTLQFENTARVHNNEIIYKSTESNLIRFSISDGSNVDNAAIGLYANATVGVDNYDSEKMFDDDASNPQVFMHIDNKDIAINGLPANQHELTVPIGIKTATDGHFTLSFNNISEIDMEYEIFLKDNLTGDIIDLRKNSEYEFYTSAINSASRLSVIISKSSTGVEELTDDFVIYYSNNSIIITANSGTQAIASVYDVSGKIVSTKNMNLVPGKNQIEINQPDGVYMVNIRNNNINITRKVVIR